MNTEETRQQILDAITKELMATLSTSPVPKPDGYSTYVTTRNALGALVDAYATLAESDRQDAIVAAQIVGGCYEPHRGCGDDDCPSEVG